ncbi:transcriptional regulatory protein [Klebsiella pneumoniae]|nr:transcriptional regulatory protein [Klebsiella pneumoniae]
MPLIEQPYLLKMVIVTERIGTALVRSENVLQSQRDILMQLVTGDYPDLQMLHQRALHQQLDFYPSAAAGGAASGGVVPPVSPVPARAGRSLAAAGPPPACVSSCSSSSTSRAIPFRC